jgi:hypothetical protein
MSPAAQAVHGISDADVADAPPAAAVLPEFLVFLGNPASTWLLAHNARFDASFLSHELGRAGLPWPGHPLVPTQERGNKIRRAPLPRIDRILGTEPSRAGFGKGQTLIGSLTPTILFPRCDHVIGLRPAGLVSCWSAR